MGLFLIIFISIASGLPLYLLLNLVPAWLRTEHVDLRVIGLFALIQFPYTWKFLWSPLIDRLPLPVLTRRLGRRRGWGVLIQLLLIAGILALGIFQIAIPYLLYSIAIRHVRAFDAILVMTLEPVLNPIWVWLIIAEVPEPWSMVGGLIVIVAILLHGFFRHRRQ